MFCYVIPGATMRNFPGAKWWKMDFHAHTPASKDYGKGSDQDRLQATTPEEWLLGHMRAEIDCVAITDHNSGRWVDPLKEAIVRLEQAAHPDYRPLHLFPGVEITAAGNIHILAVFDKAADTAKINRLLGAVHANAEDGTSDAASDFAPVQVIAEIAAAGGIPILAHVDEPRGAFRDLAGTGLAPLLDFPSVCAMELRNTGYQKPALYGEKKVRWSEVLGSDSHHPAGADGDRFPGSHYTWVKMGEPSLEGMRLALLDNAPLSIRRSDEGGDNPNKYASLFIEELQVEDARFCGRGGAFVTAFNPWLNAVIGGRGSGKSSLVEFARIGLQREDELPESLARHFTEFNQVHVNREAKGALTATTKIKLRVRKDGAKYVVQWSQDGSLQPIMQQTAEGEWEEAPGDVRQRFPVRIFSQKQVYALAEEDGALLRILDETPEVDRDNWDQAWRLELTEYLSLRAKGRAVLARLEEEKAIRGQLDDVLTKLKVFEQAEHAKLLKEYQLRQRQFQAVKGLINSLLLHEQTLRKAAEAIAPPSFESDLFNDENPADAAVLKWVDSTTAYAQALSVEVVRLAEKAGAENVAAKDAFGALEWMAGYKEIQRAYEELVTTLKAEGVSDINQYGLLVQQRQAIEGRLKEMADLKETFDGIRGQAAESFGRLVELRGTLTTLRTAFLTKNLGENRHVRIKVQQFGRSKSAVEAAFRGLIGRTDGAFANEILSETGEDGVIADLLRALPENTGDAAALIRERLEQLKREVVGCAAGRDDTRFGARFAKHLRQLQPEMIDRIICWFPEDTLSVEYSPRGDGRDFRPLQQGSPGQKTAAILAFILAHGDEPIILDQPEDDLDNHLIYDLIVSQIRENKLRRQVIVVTHNPNIVVNGDAEAVFALDQRAGQCRVVAHGCLQSLNVRNEVCRIMEGGREAFQKRYQRIIGSA
jgi:hypothetical protein